MYKRNAEIDILRLLFAVTILLHHSYFFLEGIQIFRAGSLGVDFFFLLSGYLMMIRISKEDNVKSLGKKTIQYIYRKVRSLYPELLLSAGAGLLFLMIIGAIEINRNLRESLIATFIKDVCLLKMLMVKDVWIGEQSVEILPALWYVSSMILVMFFLYPLMLRFSKNKWFRCMLYLSAIIIALLMKGLRDPYRVTKAGIYKGNFRAYVDMVIGCSLYYLVKVKFSSKYEKLLCKYTTKLKIFLIIMILAAMNMSGRIIDYFAFVMSYLLIFLCIKYPAPHRFDSKIQKACAEYSVSLFLCHSYYAKYLLSINRMEYLSNIGKMIVYLALSIITSCMVSMLSAFIRKNKKYWMISNKVIL